jgi:hypothetical protein
MASCGVLIHPFSLQRIMHSVLTGRMLLQLRQYERRIIRGDGPTELSGVTIPLEFVQKTTTVTGDDPADMELRS